MNTIKDLLSGHFKNSYGVEGMDITGRSDWKRIVPVSDEMKNHVLADVKKAFYSPKKMLIMIKSIATLSRLISRSVLQLVGR